MHNIKPIGSLVSFSFSHFWHLKKWWRDFSSIFLMIYRGINCLGSRTNCTTMSPNKQWCTYSASQISLDPMQVCGHLNITSKNSNISKIFELKRVTNGATIGKVLNTCIRGYLYHLRLDCKAIPLCIVVSDFVYLSPFSNNFPLKHSKDRNWGFPLIHITN